VLIGEHAHRDEFAAARFGELPGQAQRITAALAAVDAHDDRVEHGIWECHESSVGRGPRRRRWVRACIS
jgi:uncharacterized cupin superfamily protein